MYVQRSTTAMATPLLLLRTTTTTSLRPKLSAPFCPRHNHSFTIKATTTTTMSRQTITNQNDQAQSGGSENKKIFVAGATGQTGKRIVNQLLAKGFNVKAGVRDIEKAKSTFPQTNSIQFVKADVTDGSTKLAEAIGDDSAAVICATGFRPSFDLSAPWRVDNFGTVNLVDACGKQGIKRLILISSILVNGAAMGQVFNPAYIFLNVFGLTLVAKLQAENYIRKSGINYTIIRPGGLKNDPPTGNIVMEPEDTLYTGTISRDQVAQVAVEALILPEASYKVVEIVARTDAPNKPFHQLFGSIKQH